MIGVLALGSLAAAATFGWIGLSPWLLAVLTVLNVFLYFNLPGNNSIARLQQRPVAYPIVVTISQGAAVLLLYVLGLGTASLLS